MGYDEVYAAKMEQMELASGCTGMLRAIHLNAMYALENRLLKMTPPPVSGGPAPGATPAAMPVPMRMAA